jgi:acetyltransferase
MSTYRLDTLLSPRSIAVDINPLLADETGVFAIDARIAVSAVKSRFNKRTHQRLVIRPYPSERERQIVLGDNWQIFVRPARPEDEDLVRAFFNHVSQEDLRLRFFAPVREISHEFIARLTSSTMRER